MSAVLVLSALVAIGHGQHRAAFGFNSTQLTSWYRYYGVAPQNPLQGKTLAPSTAPVVHVAVSGNFGATFSVHGAGAATNSRNDSYIDVSTNRPLTFQANSFTTLQNGGSSVPTAGSILYEMQLYAGTSGSVGSAITAAQSGTDNGFNGATVTLASGAIPGDGHVVLRLSRTLTLGQLARGGQDYSATGTITVTIN
jgi:hypothetical protein